MVQPGHKPSLIAPECFATNDREAQTTTGTLTEVNLKFTPGSIEYKNNISKPVPVSYVINLCCLGG
jgi:hypothetical protein